MSEMVAGAKHSVWKYFGSMFMEKKDGVMALSLTRFLGLICFFYMSYLWMAPSEVPESLLYTFWGLILGKTAESFASIWKGKKGA